MARRSGAIVVAGCAAAAVMVASALAAYASPRLEVTQSGDRVTLDLAQQPGDDATASVRLVSPLGTEVAPTPTPGTTVGSATATFVATAAGDAPAAAEGPLRVVGPPSGPLSGCAAGERVVAVWSLSLTGDGLALDVPVYLLGGGDLLACLPPPSTLPRGEKLGGLRLTLDGPLDLPTAGTWISFWVPYAGTEADASRVVASPSVVGVGTVILTARAKGSGAVLVGFVRQAGAPRTGVRVRVTGGPGAAAQRALGVATTNLRGQFTFRARAGTFFRAATTVPRSSPPGICVVLEPFLRPIPCINPTLNGFAAQSRVIRKR